jgi:uncharacterized protein (DUF3820 family)
MIMPFGRHKGLDIDEVPAKYLLDLMENEDQRLAEHREVAKYIEDNLEALEALVFSEQ